MAHTSFVPRVFDKFSEYDFHLISEKIFKMATENNNAWNGEKYTAKYSENYMSVKKGCLNFLDPPRFLDASLDKQSTTLTTFPSLYANGKEFELEN